VVGHEYMSESCTIFSPSKSYVQVVTALRELGAPDISINGAEEEWRSVLLKFAVSQLALNSLVRRSSGDRFQK